MSAFSNIAAAGDLDEVTSLITLAERTAAELAKLEAHRDCLRDRFERAVTEFNLELDAGTLPVVKLAELTTMNQALSKIEAELTAAISHLEEGLN